MSSGKDWNTIKLTPEEFLLAAQVCAAYARDESPDGPRDPEPVHLLAGKFYRNAYALIGDTDLVAEMFGEFDLAGADRPEDTFT